MLRWRRPTSAEIIALITVVTVAAVMYFQGGTMFSPGALNAQSRSGSRLGGVSSHAEIGQNCAACHTAPWSGETMASRCLACHTDVRSQLDNKAPMHGLLTDGMQCRTCHTEHKGVHAELTDMSRFDHDLAAFKLTGRHRAVDCASCHIDNVFKGTAQTCVSCHAEPPVPQVHKGQFGKNCASCHVTTSWKETALSLTNPTNFDHDQTGFKLTGKHKTTNCTSCHVNNVFKGTSQACVSCHAEPPVPQVHKGRFGTNCASCHSTSSWKGATISVTTLTNFDHDQTGFKLTGKHKMVDCKLCHVNNTFKGTAQACVSCHAEPPVPAVHKVARGNNCATCHSTASWVGLAHKHTFPLTHHNKGRDIACATCHTTESYKVYTCAGCHAHEPTRMERKHAGKRLGDISNCVRCHPTGRERRRAEADSPRLNWYVDGSDMLRDVGAEGACQRLSKCPADAGSLGSSLTFRLHRFDPALLESEETSISSKMRQWAALAEPQPKPTVLKLLQVEAPPRPTVRLTTLFQDLRMPRDP